MSYYGGWKWQTDTPGTVELKKEKDIFGKRKKWDSSSASKKTRPSSRRSRGGGERYSYEERLKISNRPQNKEKKNGQDDMELKCPHCRYLSQTFKEYEEHLDGAKHQLAMKRVFVELLKVLNGMLTKQKEEQALKDSTEERRNLEIRFCFSCQLHYKDSTQEHVSSSSHKAVVEFLKPDCKICDKPFECFMYYEEHICELPHIKKKAKLQNMRILVTEDEDEQEKIKDLDGNKTENENPEQENKNEMETTNKHKKMLFGEEIAVEVSQENSNKGRETSVEKKGFPCKNKTRKKKQRISRCELIKIGMNYCQLLEVHYCGLCKKYVGEGPKSLKHHCFSKDHTSRLLRQAKLEARNAYLTSFRQKLTGNPVAVT